MQPINTHYNDHTIRFTIADTRFSTLNLVYERFRRTIPLHSHGSGSYEIHYISSGYGYALVDGRSYRLAPGCLYVTGPHILHAQSPDPNDPMCEYCIYLKLEKGKKNSFRTLSADAEAVVDTFENATVWFTPDAGQAGQWIKTLFQELETCRTGYELALEAHMKELLVWLVRSLEKGRVKAAARAFSPADKTTFLIEEYFLYQYASLSLETLASRLDLSPRQTQRLLQKHYGKTFLQMKTEARMSAASVLLTGTGDSITSIADALGYSSMEHFSAAFKSYYQITPRQYRKSAAYHEIPSASLIQLQCTEDSGILPEAGSSEYSAAARRP